MTQVGGSFVGYGMQLQDRFPSSQLLTFQVRGAKLLPVNMNIRRALVAGLIIVIFGSLAVGCSTQSAAPITPTREVVKPGLLEGWTFYNSDTTDDWRAHAGAQLEKAGALSKDGNADIIIHTELQGEKKFVLFLFHGQERRVWAYTLNGVRIGDENPNFESDINQIILDMVADRKKGK